MAAKTSSKGGEEIVRTIPFVLFVSALNAMHVGVLRGECFCNILLGEYQF